MCEFPHQQFFFFLPFMLFSFPCKISAGALPGLAGRNRLSTVGTTKKYISTEVNDTRSRCKLHNKAPAACESNSRSVVGTLETERASD